jgi:hypothetical protein
VRRYVDRLMYRKCAGGALCRPRTAFAVFCAVASAGFIGSGGIGLPSKAVGRKSRYSTQRVQARGRDGFDRHVKNDPLNGVADVATIKHVGNIGHRHNHEATCVGSQTDLGSLLQECQPILLCQCEGGRARRCTPTFRRKLARSLRVADSTSTRLVWRCTAPARATVDTPSSEQVRQPLFRERLTLQWQRRSRARSVEEALGQPDHPKAASTRRLPRSPRFGDPLEQE